MAGRKRLPRKARLASGKQLFVLNRAGHLHLGDEELEPISSAEADAAIRRSIQENADRERTQKTGSVPISVPDDEETA